MARTLSSDFALEPQVARSLRYTPREKQRLHAYSLVTLALTYGCIVAASWMPALPWLVPVAFFITATGAVRYAGYIHALNHAYRLSEPVPWLLELLPAPSTPFIPGFSETRKIHLAHHKLETAAGDPDNYIIGSPNRVVAYLRCAFLFEYWFYYVLRREGWTSRMFWRGWLFRLVLFSLLFAAAGWKMLLVYMVASKVGIGIAFYLVSYAAHVEGRTHGNYLVPSVLSVYRLSCLLVGPYATEAAGLHAVHHAKPSISCGKLAQAYQSWSARKALPISSYVEPS